MLRRLVVAAFVAVLTLAACEGAIRLYSSIAYPKMMILDDELGWRHAPNKTKTMANELGQEVVVSQNGMGFRGPEYPEEPTPGTYRILVLGDSFTEGSEVAEDELFTSLLDERGGAGVEVLNSGVAGWGTVQEFLFLEQTGLDLHPDLVLLMFYGNDFNDNCLSHSPGFGPRPYAVSSGGSIEIRVEPELSSFRRYILPMPFSTWLNRHSYVFNFLNSRLYQPRKGAELSAMLDAEMREAQACGEEAFHGLLGRMNDRLQDENVSLAVGLIPGKLDLEEAVSPTDGPILETCRARSIPCVSLWAPMRDAENREELYFHTDIHWTAAGHRAAADALWPLIDSIRPT